MTDQAPRVVFDDPHQTGPAEAETMRVRTLSGVWRWALVVADGRHHLPLHQSAVRAALLHRLHAAQHRVLLSPHPLHAALHLPDLSGKPEGIADAGGLVRRRALRRHRGRVVLSHDAHPRGRRARLGVRRSACPDHLGRLCDVDRAAGGAAPHRRVEPDAVRVPLHCLSPVCRSIVARPAQGQPVDPRPDGRLPRSFDREPARHPDPGLRRRGDRLPGVRHRPDDDRRRQVLHQSGVRAVRHIPRRRGKGRHLRLGPARHDVGQHRQQRADRRHHDDPDHEADRLHRLLRRRHRSLRLDRRRAGAAGDGRHRLRDGAVHRLDLRRSGHGRHHSGDPLLCRPVHAGRCLCRAPRPEGPRAPRTAAPVGYLSRKAGTTPSWSSC